MPVKSKPEDKAKIVFHAAMMSIQNFGFFIMYFSIWGATPPNPECTDTRYAVSLMSLTCFFVAFLCVGMGFGGYIDDKPTFTLYWFLHLIGGSLYTACTVIIPIARFSDTGKACAALSPVNGDRVEFVYYIHAALYLVYVGGMLSITYFSFLKTILPKLPQLGLLVAVVVIFVFPQAIVYATVL